MNKQAYYLKIVLMMLLVLICLNGCSPQSKRFKKESATFPDGIWHGIKLGDDNPPMKVRIFSFFLEFFWVHGWGGLLGFLLEQLRIGRSIVWYIS